MTRARQMTRLQRIRWGDEFESRSRKKSKDKPCVCQSECDDDTEGICSVRWIFSTHPRNWIRRIQVESEMETDKWAVGGGSKE